MPSLRSYSLFALVALAIGGAPLSKAQSPAEMPPPEEASGQNCTFRSDPDEFLSRETRARQDAYERILRVSQAFGKQKSTAAAVSAASMPRRNFIDEEIFSRLEKEGIAPAPISTDEEFIRRIYLDLTGRIPTPNQIREFVADQAPDKRDVVIERLLYSPEFTDKWTLWMGDLLQNARVASNRNQNTEGRNRMYEWIRASIDSGKSFRDIAYEAIAITGNNFDRTAPGTNYVVRSFAPMGPAQDTYDMMLSRASSMFLGMGHYDCLLCHDGKRHLDTLSAWGGAQQRQDAHKMAAFFARTQMTRYPTNDQTDFYFDSWTITERATGTYDLNTSSGNRPNRVAYTIDGKRVANLTPTYRDGRAPAANGNWREAFARYIADDPMFARNFANRFWKSMFNLGLAEPVDSLDPARLDPDAPPPAGWSYQASHPALLEKLARAFRESDLNLRPLLRLIAQSNAYQLSSRYEGDWKFEYTTLYARHIPRRIDGEEAHDAIVKATGVVPAYRVLGFVDPVNWAMQLPEPTEPQSDGTANNFMNSFVRGNRDTLARSQSGSIIMWLNMMNSSFVINRARVTASPVLQNVKKLTSDEDAVNELFLTFLSRSPSDYEKGIALKQLKKVGTGYTRDAALEDLAWALINKVDFLFSY